MRRDFSEEDRIKCLLWSNRHCCLCGKACGTDIEIAHIIQAGPPDIDNAIPLCYECHSEIGRYNSNHPRGNRYRPRELRARREQIYEEQTRHLVPPVDFQITRQLPSGQEADLPIVGFVIRHLADHLPVGTLVSLEVRLAGRKLRTFEDGPYSGKHLWHLNPRLTIHGHFQVPSEAVGTGKQLKLTAHVTIIDQYERQHPLLPMSWIFNREHGYWFLEP